MTALTGRVLTIVRRVPPPVLGMGLMMFAAMLSMRGCGFATSATIAASCEAGRVAGWNGSESGVQVAKHGWSGCCPMGGVSRAIVPEGRARQGSGTVYARTTL